MGLDSVKLSAGFAQCIFHCVQSGFEPVDTGSLASDERFGRGLFRLVALSEQTNYRTGDSCDGCDDADDDFSRHLVSPRLAPGRGR